jgi:nucleoid-associated protein YgaU
MMSSAPPAPPALQASKTQADTKSETKSATPPPPMNPIAVEQPATPPATQPVASIASGEQSGMRTHVVKPGETIAKIAEAVYGSQNYWPHIIRANPGIVAEKIRPGMTINLPPDSEVKGSGTAVTASATENPIKPDTTHPALDSKTEYEVQTGDSLAKISMKLYGSSAKWQAIYDLNKDAIGADPAKLKVKSVLKLPEPPTQKQP